MQNIKKKVIEYCLYTIIIHCYLWAALTVWFFVALNYTWDQYVTWMWQAPLVGLATNYPLGKILERFYKWWNKK